MKDKKDDKREEILAAALTTFSRYGYKQTTMDSIAEQTELSRSALYVYYKNKKDIFRSLSQNLHAKALEQASSARKIDEPFPVRLHEAFLRRDAIFGFVNESPHGAELIDVGMRVTADIAADAEQQFITILSDFFEDAIVRGEIQLGSTNVTPQLCAELLIRSSVGLKANEMPRERFHQRLEMLIRVFVAGIVSIEM